ncbi:MAG: response regulator [Flavobacteriaceae bacterium]|nr:response regulator [Flavobacteriaceae bacterium]
MIDENTLLKKKLEREIKARRQAELLLEEKSDELYDTLYNVSKSEALLQTALSSMQEGFLLTDQNLKVLLVNSQLITIYPQYAQFMRVGMNLNEQFHFFIKHPAYLNMLEEDLKQCSFEIKLDNSQIIAVHVNRNENNIIVSTHKDISQEKLIISEQQQTILKLLQAEKMEHIGKMASSVAHDFNNIIAAIKGYTSFLKEDLPDDASLHNSVDKIQEASERAQEMVKNILRFSKHSKPKLEKIDIINLINETITLLKPNIPDNISLKLNLINKAIEVNANATQLIQVFINLIKNTINAAEENSCKISISYELSDQIDLNQDSDNALQFMPLDAYHTSAGLHVFNDKCIKINYHDNGPGMIKDTMDHIFEMYFTTHNSKQGTGLGMYSVATTIIEHNGGIKIYSKPKFGTYIEIVLPMMVSNHTSVFRSEFPPITDRLYTNNKSRILIIDDNQEVGLFIQQTLKRNKVNSVYLDSAEQGLREILNEPDRWRIIICDQKMPNIFGLQILKTIRSQNINTPFILTSGYIEEYKMNPEIELVDQLIPKPINIELLLKTVNKYIK